MFRKQSFWKGSALLLASAMTAKLLGACFKIPLTNVLGGTGMGYFSTAYGLLLPVYALSVTGLSAAVAQTVSRAAALEHWSEVRRIHHAARLACGALGLLLSLCMFLLAEPFATQIAAQPHALFSLLAIAPAALFGCLTAVERGYWEGLQNMTPTALSQALEAVAKLGFGLALCMWVLRNPEVVCRWVPPEVPLSALAAAGAVLGVTLSTVLGWVYFLLHGLRRDSRLPDFPAAALRNDSGGTGLAGDEPDLSAGSGDHDALPWTGADVPRGRTGGEIRGICRPAGFSGICLRLFHRHGDHCVQSGALCHQHAGEKCSALCGGTVGEAGLPWHSGTCSLCHRSRGGDGVSGGRRAVGAGGAGDASALRRQTGRSCHCRRSPPDTAPRHGLPVPDISLVQCVTGHRQGGDPCAVHAGRGGGEAGRESAAAVPSGVLHHRCRYCHISVLSGAAAADSVAAAPLSGSTAALAAGTVPAGGSGGVLYRCGVVLPYLRPAAGHAALGGSGFRCGLSGVSGGVGTADALPETKGSYIIVGQRGEAATGSETGNAGTQHHGNQFSKIC